MRTRLKMIYKNKEEKPVLDGELTDGNLSKELNAVIGEVVTFLFSDKEFNIKIIKGKEIIK